MLVLIFGDPEPVGIVPLMLDRVERDVRIRFVGGDDLTDYLGPIVADGEHLPAIADAVVSFLLEEVGGWSYFDAKCMPVPFGFAEWLAEAADRAGLEFRIDQNEVSAILPLPTTFEEYLAGLPRKDRHELRRKMRRLERDAPDAIFTIATPETLEGDLKTFIDLHRASEGTKGRFMGPERERFFGKVARTFSALGMLHLHFLEVGGRRIASTLSFEYEETIYLYNSAFEKHTASLSPGLNLVAEMIRRGTETGIRRLDFLRGPERYKFDLGGQPIPLHSVRLTPSRPPAGQKG